MQSLIHAIFMALCISVFLLFYINKMHVKCKIYKGLANKVARLKLYNKNNNKIN